MSIDWTKLLSKIALWALSEVLLGTLNLDNLADYSEFLFKTQFFQTLGEITIMRS